MNIWKGFIDENFLTEHPDGKIKLLNGRLIDGYPKPNYGTDVEDDTFELFLSKAHMLFQNRKAILQDSRLFLAPLHVNNNLSYSGNYGFQNPTLGVYIEWWLNCKSSVLYDSNGNSGLVYFISGSLLSGMNLCMVVEEDGARHKVTLKPFQPVWQTFVSVNTRYESCKAMYEAYPLEKVLSYLQSIKNNFQC